MPHILSTFWLSWAIFIQWFSWYCSKLNKKKNNKKNQRSKEKLKKEKERKKIIIYILKKYLLILLSNETFICYKKTIHIRHTFFLKHWYYFLYYYYFWFCFIPFARHSSTNSLQIIFISSTVKLKNKFIVNDKTK